LKFTILAVLGAAVLVAAASYASQRTLVARPGPVLILEVTVSNAQAIQQLVDAGYDVDDVRGNVATVYVTEAEAAQLRNDGYSVRQIGRQPDGAKALGQYHTYASLTSDLQAYAAAHPEICRLTTLGASVQGRQLWALLITDDPDVEEDEPEFKYISTIHGDELLGMEMCMYFIDLLLTGYGAESRITDLVDSTAIWVVPLMNPDGREIGQRYNAQGHDLNRSFPAFPEDFTDTMYSGQAVPTTGYPPEVLHVMRWVAENAFTLSACFHGGAQVVNYPYDNDGKPSGTDSPSPDDALFRDVSLRYSTHNVDMFNSVTFEDGITNGAAWYVITGGMQDWNYRYACCNDVTIELAVPKIPNATTLPDYWSKNEESMLAYLEAVHIGVRGVVTDVENGEPLWAKVTVVGNSHPVFTDPDVGDYHRMLLPGTYTLVVSAPGYFSQTIQNVDVGVGEAVRVDVQLTGQFSGPNVPAAGLGGVLLTAAGIAILAVRRILVLPAGRWR